jgi:phage shock protein A
MIDTEKAWTQQITTLTASGLPDQQSPNSQLEKNVEQLSTILLSQHPLQQRFEDLSSYRDNLEAQFRNAMQQGNSKLVRGLDTQLSGLESILLLTKLALQKTNSPMESVLDATESFAKNKGLRVLPAVPLDSIF